MRAIGLDIHRAFCEVAIHEGGLSRSAGRVKTTPEALEVFASSLGPEDWVAMEVGGNAAEIAKATASGEATRVAPPRAPKP